MSSCLKVVAAIAGQLQGAYKEVEMVVVDDLQSSLFLPLALVSELGLKKLGVRRYQGRLHDVVGPVWTRMEHRVACTDALVKEGKPGFGSTPLVHADMILECAEGKLQFVPRIRGRIVSFAKTL